jgi:mRNA interferase RelE/StbE
MANAAYELRFTKEAKEQLRNLDNPTAKQIARKINWLVENTDSIPHRALVGNLSGLFRYRISDYRVLYYLDYQLRVLLVVEIGHRRDVYKD